MERRGKGESRAQGVTTIATAFYPKDVIVRLSDFKSNEYANLLCARAYEPKEENPMLGVPVAPHATTTRRIWLALTAFGLSGH